MLEAKAENNVICFNRSSIILRVSVELLIEFPRMQLTSDGKTKILFFIQFYAELFSNLEFCQQLTIKNTRENLIKVSRTLGEPCYIFKNQRQIRIMKYARNKTSFNIINIMEELDL